MEIKFWCGGRQLDVLSPLFCAGRRGVCAVLAVAFLRAILQRESIFVIPVLLAIYRLVVSVMVDDVVLEHPGNHCFRRLSRLVKPAELEIVTTSCLFAHTAKAAIRFRVILVMLLMLLLRVALLSSTLMLSLPSLYTDGSCGTLIDRAERLPVSYSHATCPHSDHRIS